MSLPVKLSKPGCAGSAQSVEGLFVHLPQLTSLDLAELLATVRCRVLRLLTRRGVIDTTQEPSLLPDEKDTADPALALLTAVAVSGAIPAGPEFRQRAPVRLATYPPATITGPLCATDSGFTLHAATVARRDDLRGQEALLRYVLRPVLAQSRLQALDNGLCRITLKRAFSDGTFAIDLDPISLLCRLAASVPAPGFNTVRYAGVLAPAATWRSLVIPRPTARDNSDAEQHTHTPHPADDSERQPDDTASLRRSRWRPWAELLKRSFDIDLRCPRCHDPMKLKSFLTGGKTLLRLLSRLGEPVDVQGKTPARGIAQLLVTIRRRVLRHLARSAPSEDAAAAVDRLAEEEPILATCYASSIGQRHTVGPRAGTPLERLGADRGAPRVFSGHITEIHLRPGRDPRGRVTLRLGAASY